MVYSESPSYVTKPSQPIRIIVHSKKWICECKHVFFVIHHLRMFGIVNQILEDKLRDKLLEIYDGYRKDIEVCWSYLLLVKFPFLRFGVQVSSQRVAFLRTTVKATVVTCRVRNPACTTTKRPWEPVLYKWSKRPWRSRLWRPINKLTTTTTTTTI